MRAFRFILRVVGVAGLLALLAIALYGAGQPLAPGTPAPPVHRARLPDGRLADLRFGDRPTVVNIWATWCPPCLAELPELVEAQRAWGDRVTLVGLAADSDRAQVLAIIDRFDIPYQVAEIDGRTAAAWNATSLPSTYLVDASGTVVWSTRGQVDRATLDRELGELPAAPPPPPSPAPPEPR
ncbi:MAG: TlpA family protein disulfide reductase [Deltaproteobacteria bacterium]|nr:TlpA family protein disulfide reductase [Deltaproteobacteria bacterium]